MARMEFLLVCNLHLTESMCRSNIHALVYILHIHRPDPVWVTTAFRGENVALHALHVALKDYTLQWLQDTKEAKQLYQQCYLCNRLPFKSYFSSLIGGFFPKQKCEAFCVAALLLRGKCSLQPSPAGLNTGLWRTELNTAPTCF